VRAGDVTRPPGSGTMSGVLKVLVVSVPGPGHFNPMIPLVRALVGGGDRVVVAAAAEMGDAASTAGAEFHPAGNGEMVWIERLRARTRGTPGDGLAPERINHYFLPRAFGEVATDDMIDDVLAAGRAFAPDLVLFESYAMAGPLAAELMSVPAINHLLGPLLPHELWELANDAVSPLWRSFGRDAPGYAGVYRDLTIAICPPSLEPLQVPDGDTQLLRPAPLPERAMPENEDATALPLVYVTLGTFFGNPEVFRPILSGLADQPVEVVVTVGADRDPRELAPIPDNVRVERFIPQAELLPACSAVVHHGGAGTTFGSLAHGLPQVVVPQGADNFVHGAMLERAGVGRVLLPGRVTPEDVRQAVDSVLEDASYRGAARDIATEITGMPGPEEVADTLRDRYRD
jgi:UDP:flavonoid glycosyltransferase YjiC (YdhE family)